MGGSFHLEDFTLKKKKPGFWLPWKNQKFLSVKGSNGTEGRCGPSAGHAPPSTASALRLSVAIHQPPWAELPLASAPTN